MPWKPITRTADVDVEQHPERSGLFEARITLSDEPPDEWAEAFTQAYEANVNHVLHPFHLEVDEVAFNFPPGEEEAYLAALDDRIAAANRWYEERVLPAARQQEAERRTGEGERERRLEESRQRLRGGSDPKKK